MNSRPRKTVPPQVTRPLSIAAVIALFYGVAHYLLVPATFGAFGHYRGAALAELADRPLGFAGKEACAKCHETENGDLAGDSHKTLSCETCHGPSYSHAQNSSDKSFTPQKISDERFCLRCHLRNVSRPEKFPQVTDPKHSDGEPCLSCHLPHKPQEGP